MSGIEQNSEGISLQVTEIFNKTAQLFMWQCDSTEKVWDSTTFDIDLSASTTQTNSRLATTTSKPPGVHKNHNLVQKINAHYLPSYKYTPFPQQSILYLFQMCVHFRVSTKCHFSHKTSWQISWLRSLLLSSGSDQCDWCQRVSLAPQSVCTTVHS